MNTNINLQEMNHYCNDLVLLYVESDISKENKCLSILSKIFSKIYVANSSNDGLKIFKDTANINLVITDIELSHSNGLEMIEDMLKIRSSFVSIVLSEHEESSFLKRGYEVGVDDYLIKPLSLNEFKKSIFTLKSKLMSAKSKTLSDLSNVILSKNFKTLIVLDIVNFRIVNKIHGKLFGDRILQQLSNELKSFESSEALLFKIESDKYVFSLKSSDREKILSFIIKIEKKYSSEFNIDNEQIDISFNFGISSIGNDLNSLLNAEYALEQTKSSNLVTFSFYDPEDSAIKREKESAKWFKITKELIQKEDIKPVFQAIVDISTGKVAKYEVLARGILDGNDIAPFFFIPAAEKLGLISEVTKIIIRKSFEFFSKTEFEFSINISGEDLKDNFLEDYLNQQCKLLEINPSQVTLEILENITIANESNTIIKQIRSLKNKGFNIAIDDFGADNSNFSRLLDIDCDILKIDMLFIKDIDKNVKYQLIVRSIVYLAKRLGMKTVAEYVENAKIYNIVKDCGVDYAQGYFISKPESSLMDPDYIVDA